MFDLIGSIFRSIWQNFGSQWFSKDCHATSGVFAQRIPNCWKRALNFNLITHLGVGWGLSVGPVVGLRPPGTANYTLSEILFMKEEEQMNNVSDGFLKTANRKAKACCSINDRGAMEILNEKTNNNKQSSHPPVCDHSSASSGSLKLRGLPWGLYQNTVSVLWSTIPPKYNTTNLFIVIAWLLLIDDPGASDNQSQLRIQIMKIMYYDSYSI